MAGLQARPPLCPDSRDAAYIPDAAAHRLETLATRATHKRGHIRYNDSGDAAYIAAAAGTPTQLWQRMRHAIMARPLPCSGSGHAAWSPDATGHRLETLATQAARRRGHTRTRVSGASARMPG